MSEHKKKIEVGGTAYLLSGLECEVLGVYENKVWLVAKDNTWGPGTIDRSAVSLEGRKENSYTDYYKHLAHTVLRMWEHPTSDLEKMYVFLNTGLTYGPSYDWPDLLIEAWTHAGMPDVDGSWPCQDNFEKAVFICRDYINNDRNKES